MKEKKCVLKSSRSFTFKDDLKNNLKEKREKLPSTPIKGLRRSYRSRTAGKSNTSQDYTRSPSKKYLKEKSSKKVAKEIRRHTMPLTNNMKLNNKNNSRLIKSCKPLRSKVKENCVLKSLRSSTFKDDLKNNFKEKKEKLPSTPIKGLRRSYRSHTAGKSNTSQDYTRSPSKKYLEEKSSKRVTKKIRRHTMPLNNKKLNNKNDSRLIKSCKPLIRETKEKHYALRSSKIDSVLKNSHQKANKKATSLSFLESEHHSHQPYSAKKSDKLQSHNKKISKKCPERKSFVKTEQNINKRIKQLTESFNNGRKKEVSRINTKTSSRVNKFPKSHQLSFDSENNQTFETLPVDTLISKKLSFSKAMENQVFKTPARPSNSRRVKSEAFLRRCNQDLSICRLTLSSPKKRGLKMPKRGVKRPRLTKKSLKHKCKSTFELEDEGYEDDLFADEFPMLASTPQVLQDSDLSGISNFPTPKLNFILTPIKPKKTPRCKDIISPATFKIARKVALECMRDRFKRENSKCVKEHPSSNINKPETKKLDFLEVLAAATKKEKELEEIMQSSDEENSYFSFEGE